MMKSKIEVDWTAPDFVKAFQSDASLKILNNFVNEQPKDLFAITNRKFSLVNQIHSNKVIQVYKNDHHLTCDGIFTYEPNVIVAVRTADCIPVLLSNEQGSFVAAIHCGWRGLSAGIIRETLKKIKTNYEDVVAWIGPGISQKHFETDRDVYDSFNKKYNFLAKHFIYKNNKFYTDLIGITASLLKYYGVQKIFGNSISQNYCTFSDDFLFSHRQNKTQYRLISMAWINT